MEIVMKVHLSTLGFQNQTHIQIPREKPHQNP